MAENEQKTEFVARCTAISMHRATNSRNHATNNCNEYATNNLKALAGAVLERNEKSTATAIYAKKQCNELPEKNVYSLHSNSGVFECKNDPPPRPLEPSQTQAITRWVESFGGSPETIAEELADVLQQCRNDPDALAYFLKRAEEVPADTDTRRYCHQCRHSRKVPNRIQIIHCVKQDRRWLDDMPRHCPDFTPIAKEGKL